jgi:hypothetical protein
VTNLARSIIFRNDIRARRFFGTLLFEVGNCDPSPALRLPETGSSLLSPGTFEIGLVWAGVSTIAPAAASLAGGEKKSDFSLAAAERVSATELVVIVDAAVVDAAVVDAAVVDAAVVDEAVVDATEKWGPVFVSAPSPAFCFETICC